MAQQKPQAKFIDCPGMSEGRYYHSMRDNCWSCAPYWERIPVCPTDGKRLNPTKTTGYYAEAVNGYCRTCRCHFDILEPVTA